MSLNTDFKKQSSLESPIRWAGGKRWLVYRHPEIFAPRNGRLIELFAGSAAVFFATEPRRALLADSNGELIEVYRALQQNSEKVWDRLQLHGEKHSKEYYYGIRSLRPKRDWEVAARFLYLNRTCFNALYRVNRRGEFNVPVGDKNSVFRAGDDFERVSLLLQRARLVHGDFEKTLALAKKGDLVYADPPYTVKHNLNGFLKYNEKIFTFDDQIRLRRALGKAAARGVDVLVSNADHESVRQLYRGFGSMRVVERTSLISGRKDARGMTTELLIGKGRNLQRLLLQVGCKSEIG